MTVNHPEFLDLEHRQLDDLLRAHLLDLLSGDFARALGSFVRWGQVLQEHMETEERDVFPHIPRDARWSVEACLREHERIRLRVREYQQLLQTVIEHVPCGEHTRSATILALLDLAYPMRHVLRHHNQREEMALSGELLKRALEPGATRAARGETSAATAPRKPGSVRPAARRRAGAKRRKR